MTQHRRTAEPGLWKCVRNDARLVTRRRRSVVGRVATLLTNRGFQAVLLYRVSHAMWRSRIPILPLILSRLSQHLYAVDIDYRATIGPGLVLVHCFGIVVGNAVEIAGDCCIYHGVTLGNRGSEWVGSARSDGQPKVGESCMFGAGAKVLGKLRIGRNSVVGANAVVLSDVPVNSIVAGVPARVVGVRPEMDENLQRVAAAGERTPDADK